MSFFKRKLNRDDFVGVYYGSERWFTQPFPLEPYDFIGTFRCRCGFIFNFECHVAGRSENNGPTVYSNYIGPHNCKGCGNILLALIKQEKFDFKNVDEIRGA